MSGFCTQCGAGFDQGDRFCAKCGAPRAAQASSAAPAQAAAPTTAPTSSPTAGKTGRVVLATAIAPLLVAFGLFFAVGDCRGSTEGSVVVSGGPHGSFTFTPTGCASMQPFGRFGANLHGDGPNDGAVYVTVDHRQGRTVEVEVPGSCRNADGTDCTVFPLPRDRCSVFDAQVELSGVVVNDVRLVEGHVRVDCALEDGTTVRGQITFDNC